MKCKRALVIDIYHLKDKMCIFAYNIEDVEKELERLAPKVDKDTIIKLLLNQYQILPPKGKSL
jgi:hypothetical protein